MTYNVFSWTLNPAQSQSNFLQCTMSVHCHMWTSGSTEDDSGPGQLLCSLWGCTLSARAGWYAELSGLWFTILKLLNRTPNLTNSKPNAIPTLTFGIVGHYRCLPSKPEISTRPCSPWRTISWVATGSVAIIQWPSDQSLQCC